MSFNPESPVESGGHSSSTIKMMLMLAKMSSTFFSLMTRVVAIGINVGNLSWWRRQSRKEEP